MSGANRVYAAIGAGYTATALQSDTWITFYEWTTLRMDAHIPVWEDERCVSAHGMRNEVAMSYTGSCYVETVAMRDFSAYSPAFR